MEETNTRSQLSALPLILLAAVVQGWALYALHLAIEHTHWPATDPAWLISLYILALFIPVTAQLLSEYAGNSFAWIAIACLGVAFFYFGWHQGRLLIPSGERNFDAGELFPFAFVLLVLWLHALPFLQCRLRTGRWRPEYRLLFTTAWRNVLTLGEAGLFTGLFWLLLFLWQMLFHMLGIDYFRELFKEPIFIYPVTALAFGLALHLIGSVEGFITVVLAQILNVLKWLAVVAGVILALFTFALLFKLPNLVFEGQRAIGAAWLLWLIAVMVLLLNAAYRDGEVERPYPRWIALALRFVTPLTLIISMTALYALHVRAREYGLTVGRVWALVVAGSAASYSIGYTIAAFGKGIWMQGIARVNVIVALALIVTVSLALTPVLSPDRLSANSQYQFALNGPTGADADSSARTRTAFHYLRFDAGQYGLRKLQALAEIKDNPRAEAIRKQAEALLAQKSPWDRTLILADLETRLAKMSIYPAGVLDAQLKVLILANLRDPNQGFINPSRSDETWAGLYVDLNHDQQPDFVLLTPLKSLVYVRRDAQWQLRGELSSVNATSWKDVLQDLRAGNVSTQLPEWSQLSVGARKYVVVDSGK